MRKARKLSVLLATVLFASSALAEPTAADRATARTLAQEGQDALDAKKYSVSVDRFSRAEALVHAPTLLLGLARAQLGLGNLVEAQENYNRIIREGVAPGAPKSWAKALDAATKEVQVLAPRIPWVTINVTGSSSPQVALDSTPVPAASLGVRRAVNPGDHTVKAFADGFLPSSKSISLVEGQSLSVTLDLEPAPAPPPPPPVAETTPPPLVPETSKSSGGTRKTLMFVSYGVGAAGLITGGVAGVLALQKHNHLKTVCTLPDSRCPDSETSNLNAYHTMTTVSTIGFIAGGVGVVAGTILLLTLPGSSSQQTGVNPRLSPFVGWGSAGVEGTW
jgi:hypothetical protein